MRHNQVFDRLQIVYRLIEESIKSISSRQIR